MRELTQAEIELFDFTGRIPELNISGLAGKTTSHANPAKTNDRLKVRSLGLYSKTKHRPQLGRARPA